MNQECAKLLKEEPRHFVHMVYEHFSQMEIGMTSEIA